MPSTGDGGGIVVVERTTRCVLQSTSVQIRHLLMVQRYLCVVFSTAKYSTESSFGFQNLYGRWMFVEMRSRRLREADQKPNHLPPQQWQYQFPRARIDTCLARNALASQQQDRERCKYLAREAREVGSA